ncbi:Tn7 transposase TnsA N-terminal domain-containing protein [Chromobacterium piscinae]|uniref:Tn7 transposase TnsA N-terminal domain-containing protein n=1 Tax=Chromobacterium piscinae TaxID=686831 RepID=UPI001E2A6F6C|nr:Tn7 transposase TnsA N-terminal domain-containing protein [Chromobacterium piscinae]MCD4504173.1 Tn7 transposase TnsA N-terminal domain-containing protein [Chromobacterium piscinae]
MLIPSVRKIHNRNSRKVIGFIYIPKMEGHVAWESQLEFCWLLQLAGDKSVSKIVSQPIKLSYLLEGEWRSYTPDVLVQWKDKSRSPTLYEVKPIKKAKKYRAKFQAIKQEAAKKGYKFLVVSEDVINQEPLNKNLKKLKHYSDVFVHSKERALICAALAKHTCCTIAKLASYFPSRSSGLCLIYKLLWDGFLFFNIHEELTTQSKVSLGQEVTK